MVLIKITCDAEIVFHSETKTDCRRSAVTTELYDVFLYVLGSFLCCRVSEGLYGLILQCFYRPNFFKTNTCVVYTGIMLGL